MDDLTEYELRIVNEALASYRSRLAEQAENHPNADAFQRAIRDTQTAQRKLNR